MQAFDCVTTAMELEAGAFSIKKAYAYAQSLSLPLNYGYSASWSGARLVVADNVSSLVGTFETMTIYFSKPEWSSLLSAEKSSQVIKLLEQEMLDGGVGIGVVAGYAPKSNKGLFAQISFDGFMGRFQQVMKAMC